MTNQVLLDEFKDLIETITMAVIQDINHSQMSEEMVSKVLKGQVEQSVKAFKADAAQVEKDLGCVTRELTKELQGTLEQLQQELPKEVKKKVMEQVETALGCHQAELSSRVEKIIAQHQSVILERVNEKARNILSAVQEIQEDQIAQQKVVQQQGEKIEAVYKTIENISALMQTNEDTRKEERAQDLELAQMQNAKWEKKFKMLMWTQGATLLLLAGSLIYMVSR